MTLHVGEELPHFLEDEFLEEFCLAFCHVRMALRFPRIDRPRRWLAQTDDC